MRFIVYGLGAIGGVVAARLVQSGHEVLGIARQAQHDAISENGLILRSPSGVETIRVPVVLDPGETSLGAHDVVLLAMKAFDAVPAMRRLFALGADVPVVCLQNGVSTEREGLRFFKNVYSIPVVVPAVYLQPGRVDLYSAPCSGVLDVGKYPRGVDNLASQLSGAFTAAGFSSRPDSSIMRWKYGKLLMNLRSAVDALCGRDAPTDEIVRFVQEEGAGVLQSAGIEYSSIYETERRSANHLVELPVDGHARPGGSTWQSIARGDERVETEYFNGEIVRIARVYGRTAPLNEALFRMIARSISAGIPAKLSAKDLAQELRYSTQHSSTV